MGAKVIDTQLTESMYTETAAYKVKVLGIAEEIQQHVKVLSNPEILDGMRGGQGDEAIKAIKDVINAANDLSARARTICKFIDSKLEAASVLRNKEQGFSAAASKAKGATANIKK